MKFEKGKTYLAERTSKHLGGGLFEKQIENMVGEDYIKVNGNWKRYKSFSEEWNILADITEDDK